MTFLKFAKLFIKRIGLLYVDILNKKEYHAQKFVGINERPIEYQFVFKHLTQKWPETVLDVGTGTTALPHLIRNCGFVVTAIDNIQDYWPSGMFNRHYYVMNDDITKTRLNKKFDFITCVSVLEHIKNHEAAVKSMFSLLNPMGYLILTFPYNKNKYIENVYKLPCSSVKEELPFITQAYSRNEVDKWISDNNGTIMEQEYWQFFSGEYWTCGERVCPPIRVDRDVRHQISCILIQKNR